MHRCATSHSPITMWQQSNGAPFPNARRLASPLYVVLGGSFIAYICVMTAQEVTPSHSGEHVQLCTALSSRPSQAVVMGIGNLRLAKRESPSDSYSLGSIHRDPKQVEGGL